MRTSTRVLSTGLALLAATVATAVPAPARAAEAYDGCKGFIDSLPATIGTQGVWCLRKDLSTGMTSGSAITINTNNVTIDCNDFKLGGLAAGSGTVANGIYALQRFNVTVRNCNVRGFGFGIQLIFGGSHLVERNRLDGNTRMGIRVVGAGSTVRGNWVVDTGGATQNASTSTTGIAAQDGVDVIDNTVSGVMAPDHWVNGDVAAVQGIRTFQNGEGCVTGNRIRGLVPFQSGWARGIYTTTSGRQVIRDNDVQGPDVVNSYGIICSSNQATARGNVVTGFNTGISGCALSSNYVNPN